MRQFSLGKLFLALTSLAIAAGLWAWFREAAYLLSASIVLFWTSVSLFWMSDCLDHREPGSRHFVSETLNFLGLVSIVIALVAGVGGFAGLVFLVCYN